MNDVPDDGLVTAPSALFGEICVPAEEVIEFPAGVVGFPRHRRFAILQYKPPFSFLHSLDDPTLAFVVVDAIEFGEHYRPEPPVGDQSIELRAEDELAVLVVVTVPPDPKDATANLKAPLFVNLRTRKAVQIVYDDPALSSRFPFWQQEGGES